MDDVLALVVGVAFVALIIAAHCGCASKSCSAGRRPRMVDDVCMCVEEPR